MVLSVVVFVVLNVVEWIFCGEVKICVVSICGLFGVGIVGCVSDGCEMNLAVVCGW